MGLGLHLEGCGHAEQLSKQAGEGYLGKRALEDGFADRPAGLNEGVEGLMAGHVTGVEMDFRDTPVIAGKEAQQYPADIAPGASIQPAHDAEIDRVDGAVGADEKVAGVEIGVEEAVAENLVEKGP